MTSQFKYSFEQLIDVDSVAGMLDLLYRVARVPSAVVSMNGAVLAGAGWQRICTDFHRKNPESAALCSESDAHAMDVIGTGKPSYTYECPHGLVDSACPVTIDGHHVGNVFTGQMLKSPLDEATRSKFRAQALRFGYDESDYMKALEEVPVSELEKQEESLQLLASIASQLAVSAFNKMTVLEQSERLRRSASNFSALANQSTEGISVADLAGNYTYVNPAFCEMVGWCEADLLEMTVFDVTADEQDKETFSRTKTVEEGKPVQVRLVRKDRSEFVAEVTGKILSIGGQKSVLGTIRDLTEQRRVEQDKLNLEKQILQTQKLESLGVLAGGIAHDFNNILMGIMGNADLALMEMDSADPALEFVQGISDASQKAASLIQQMLAYSGKGRFTLEPINLNLLVADTIRVLRASVSKQVKIEFSCPDEPALLEGDPTQISQIIVNLVINASDALGSDCGTIEVSTGVQFCDRAYIESTVTEAALAQEAPAVEGMYSFIKVSDTGPGMSESTRSRIFEPFFTTKFTGRGLGLSAVLGIVQGHQGLIKVDSSEGQGATFTVLFHTEPDPKNTPATGTP